MAEDGGDVITGAFSECEGKDSGGYEPPLGFLTKAPAWVVGALPAEGERALSVFRACVERTCDALGREGEVYEAFDKALNALCAEAYKYDLSDFSDVVRERLQSEEDMGVKRYWIALSNQLNDAQGHQAGAEVYSLPSHD